MGCGLVRPFQELPEGALLQLVGYKNAAEDVCHHSYADCHAICSSTLGLLSDTAQAGQGFFIYKASPLTAAALNAHSDLSQEANEASCLLLITTKGTILETLTV